MVSFNSKEEREKNKIIIDKKRDKNTMKIMKI